jgi:hypothetical protein
MIRDAMRNLFNPFFMITYFFLELAFICITYQFFSFA